MRKNFSAYLLLITVFQNNYSMEQSSTPKTNQQLRNQIAFASICENNELSKFGYLFTDGSTDLNCLYDDPQKIKRTALSIAARQYTYPVTTGNYYNPYTIQWLLDNKANPNIIDESGRTAVLWANGSFQGDNESPVTLFLKDNLVDINQIYTITNIGDLFQRYQPKVTLLTAAVLNTWEVFGYPAARYNLVRALLKFNPDRNLAPNGKTALQIAQELGDKEMVKILQE